MISISYQRLQYHVAKIFSDLYNKFFLKIPYNKQLRIIIIILNNFNIFQMAQKQQISEYTFCFNEELPRSLIMLGNSDKVLPVLLASPNEIFFIWLKQNQDPKLEKNIYIVQSELQINIIKYENLTILSNHIQQNRLKQNMLVICNLKMELQVQKLKQIKYIIFYPAEQVITSKEYSQSCYYALDQIQLKNILLNYKKQNWNHKYKWLPNFLNLNNQTARSNIMVRAMWAMLKCKADSKTRILVIQQLQKLVQKLQNLEENFQASKQLSRQFIQQLEKGDLSCERSIYWYTLQSPIFKLVNNLFRSTQWSCLLFYIQPYFYSLFQAISLLYKQQKCRRHFSCFRGGKVTMQQVERFNSNIGGIIQNLGFLSTTLDKQVAQMYAENARFQIVVDQYQYSENSQFGYADISQLSNYIQESEILFNPLNYFNIVSIKQTTVNLSELFFQIQLKFVDYQIDKSANTQQKLSNWLIMKQHSYVTKIQSQGQSLVFEGIYEEGGLTYWKKFTQIAQIQLEKTKLLNTQILSIEECLKIERKISDLQAKYAFGLTQIAYTFQITSQYEKAMQIYKKAEQACKQLNYQSLTRIHMLNRVANFCFIISDSEKSLKYYLESQQAIRKLYGFDHYQMAQVINNIANIFLQSSELDKALCLYKESIKIKENLYRSKNFYDEKILVGIGGYYRKKKLYSKALQFYYQSLVITSKIYGQDNHYANMLDIIADLYLEKGQCRKSLQTIKKALSIKEKCYGQNHLSVARTLSIAGKVFYSQSLYKNAVQYFLRSNYILKQCGYLRSMHLAANLFFIGHIYFQNDQVEKALSCYQQARQISSRNSIQLDQQSSLMYVVYLASISSIYLKRKQLDKALKISLAVQDVVTKRFLKQKSLYALEQTLKNIADIYIEKKMITKGLSYLERLLSLNREMHGSFHACLVENLMKIAKINFNGQSFTKAEPKIIEAETIVLKIFGNHHPRQAQILHLKSDFQQAQGKLELSLVFLSQSLKIYKNMYKTNHPSTLRILIRAADICINIGMLRDGLRLYKLWIKIVLGTQISLERLRFFQILEKITKVYARSMNKQLGKNFLYKKVRISWGNDNQSKLLKINNKLKEHENYQINRFGYADF